MRARAAVFWSWTFVLPHEAGSLLRHRLQQALPFCFWERAPPRRDANASEQEHHKDEVKRITADNKKLADEMARKDKEAARLRDKLKTDLRTLEKPNPPPPFLVHISMRHFLRLDAESFTLWLNWQPENNGRVGLKKT